MVSPARRVCYLLLSQIESGHLFSDDALNSESMESLEPRDRHLVTEIVYGSLRWQGMLDYVLAAYSSRPWEKVIPGVRVLLRMSLYQLWHMDRIPDHALVNDAVELAKRELGRGTERFLNGVLRSLTRSRSWQGGEFTSKAPPWLQVSLPEWLWKRWVQRYGEQSATEFALSLNKPPQHTLRYSGSADFESMPAGLEASDIVPGAFIRHGDEYPEIDQRVFHYQDEASQLIPHLLGDISGARIWDACAAPGGKAAVLCRNCGDAGLVIASDLRFSRAAGVTGVLKDAGCSRARVIVADAGKPAPFRILFDAGLADVPCSGLGTLRRNPEIKWRFRPETLPQLGQRQLMILHQVSQAIRTGGRLLYSTCSTEPEENEQVIESFLADHPDFQLQQPVSPAGIERWTGPDKLVRTYPSTRGWDGFFAAMLGRDSHS
jgi:16S rRNA (cytosine967-C5)-methyltransferase